MKQNARGPAGVHDAAGLLPSARRTPSSCERRATVNVSSPWMPTPAMRSAMIESTARSRICTTRGAVWSSTISLINLTLETGWSGSTVRMIPRIAGSRPATLPAALTASCLGG